ncbi:PH domain-containing protein [Altererythrobacter sp.]|uniref:PH domain-containing protein n=1 Tax=Altererythrobacter sp. TaxID=1872480 RepID=UPI003D0ED68B
MEHETEPAVPAAQDDALTNLHPNHVKALRLKTMIVAAPFLLGALILEGASVLPPGLILGPVALLALMAVLRLPLRRHLARGYAMDADRLRVVRGILFRSDTVVPFGRVQHIDVNQGPIERYYSIATLTLHTAGVHNAAVDLPGLAPDLAREMREEIRAHIRRETL